MIIHRNRSLKHFIFTLLLIYIALFTISCTSTINKNIDTHSSKISLDYTGVYKGVIPSASGQGIDVKISLRSNNTYNRVLHYIGEDNNFIDSGKYSWDKNIITLNKARMAPLAVFKLKETI